MADLRMLILSLFFMAMALSASADILLENQDFETPPTNMTAANTSSANPFLLTAGINTLPGWSYSGKVWYVSSSPNYSLPGDGHGVRLGDNGKINQTFKADAQNVYYYVLSFTFGAESEECYNNLTALNVSDLSVPGKSRVFFLGSSFSSRRDLWETHGYYVGQWGGRYDSINLEIGSVSSSAQPNVSCWPVVDTLVIKTLGPPIQYSGNLLCNGGFEVGPSFIRNSTHGIILDDEQNDEFDESLLQQWSIIGTVKYIDSKNYFVPKGKAAIELISGAPSGISSDQFLTTGSTYILEFLMGDANDSCVADFIVYVQVGNLVQNFTMRSYGYGSYQNFSMTFKAAETSLTSGFSITCFNEYRNANDELCGPVIDDVVLLPTSDGVKTVKLSNAVTIFSLAFIFVILLLGR